ncbi:MAG TPA: aminodeoxychorismate synthase component I [Geobacteraceae bacterium]|nr:aminodeoxychorismate synthase component I [Geobacteraceae bacterium]
MSDLPHRRTLRGATVMKGPRVILESFDGERDRASFCFAELVEVIAAYSLEQLLPALRRVEIAVTSGRHAAGFISYEAAPGLNPDLTTFPPGEFPLLWFGIFAKRLAVSPPPADAESAATYQTGNWQTSLSPERYAAAVARVREYIAAGDTYQVNLTMRRKFSFAGDPALFYQDLCRSQRAPFCAYLDLERYKVLSASPELFFRLGNGTLITRPMKGTANRGRWYEEDEEAKRRLKANPKERAENLMIVDLLRNDMGMVSSTGSVAVQSLFNMETLETVHQMTSTISSRLEEGVGIVELFQALFPCGSVTGAPKKRTMEIIAKLEKSPRGLYTGCIGFISPGPEAVFSVAIRTIVIDTATGDAELGVGSGITYDSRADAEYAECLAKGRFAHERRPEFQLIETIRFEDGDGFFLLERHLERLRRSAAYFGFLLDSALIRKTLAVRSAPLFGSYKVRLLLSRNGTFTIQTEPVPADRPGTILRAAFAGQRVDSRDPFLYHKSTHRPQYVAEQAKRPECVDLIFVNERDEVTEGASNNIVARINGEMVTPSLECGLLPGVFREELLERGEIRELVITPEQLKSAGEIHLINSVRKWRRVKLV